MRRWRKLLGGCGLAVLALVAVFVLFVGPWPTYATGYEKTRYYQDAVAAIAENAAASECTSCPGRLLAGWGVSDMTPGPGVPMAGYSARDGKPATGAHDPLHVKALAFSDGRDVAVLIGADMLLVPENVAAKVRERVASQTPLTANSLYFAASHTHEGPGAFGPGLVAKAAAGTYNPEVAEFLAAAFTDAILKAYRSLAPAKMAAGSVSAARYIRNRARKGPVDPELSFLAVEKDTGERCYLASFSAHPTVVGPRFMQFTAEYPGFLQQAIERETGATAVYLGGAVGSMGPDAPHAAEPIARAQAMGEALAQLILESAKDLEFQTHLDVASVGVPLQLPPFQIRPRSSRWRLSPFLPPLLGANRSGWMQAVRIGDVLFVGVPGDFSGEISVKWKEWALARNYELWTTSFCGDYAGYISPDAYYDQVTDENGGLAYETGLMSWTGPHQEAYFTAFMKHMVSALCPFMPEPGDNEQDGASAS